jgi:hypothetical protein
MSLQKSGTIPFEGRQMRNRVTFSFALIASLVFGIAALMPGAVAQQKTATDQAFDPHDLSGVWEAPVRVTTGKEVPPMTAWGKERFEANKPFNAIEGGRMVPLAESNDPMIICDPLGFPRNIFYEIRHMKFVQTPDEVVQLLQYQGIWREIWTDGRKLPANVGVHGGVDPRWYGYSVGHWDGTTFAVDTTGLREDTWLDVYGDPHSAQMHVEERYTRLDHDRLSLTVTIDDPKAYTKPFVALRGLIFRLATKAGVSGQIPWPNSLVIPEQMCVPSEALNYLKAVAQPADGGKSTSPWLK